MIKLDLSKHITRITGYNSVKVDQPSHLEQGDYATNLALIESKRQNRPAFELAKEIENKLNADEEFGNIVSRIEVAQAGFINFWLSEDILRQEINSDLSQFEAKNEQKYLVEYAHPNTHKAFHIGHLRNITTGEALSRILSASGKKIVRVNYQGDVGLHIAKAIFGILEIDQSDPEGINQRASYLAKCYVHGNLAYEENEGARNEILEINKKLYTKSDQKLNEIYDKTRSWSLDYFEKVYQRLGTTFDRYYFESEVAGSAIDLVGKAKENGILEESDGAIVYKGEKDGLHTRVFLSGEGNPTYEAKDLALSKLQFDEYTPDKILHIVGPEQSEYFKVVFKVIEQVFPELKDKEMHVPYGWVSLKDGKMSSRKGNVILGEWLLDEAKSKILETFDIDEDTAEKVAVAAVKYSFLKTSLTQEVKFEIEESISIEGNSGPYLQYTFARTQSVLEKVTSEKDHGNQTKPLLLEERVVLVALAGFNEAVLESAEKFSPNLLCNYLFDLAQKYNAFYNKHKILSSDNELFRLWLTDKVAGRLKEGLNLLGIEAPEKM